MSYLSNRTAGDDTRLRRRVLLYGYAGYGHDHAEWRKGVVDGWSALEEALSMDHATWRRFTDKVMEGC